MEKYSIMLIAIVLAIQTAGCKRSGFDFPADVTLPPEPVQLSKADQDYLQTSVEEVLQLCNEEPENWGGPEVKRRPRIWKHPQLSRFYRILDRLFAEAHDSRASWKIIIFDARDEGVGDMIACPGNYMFVNTKFFDDTQLESVIAIRAAHALGHAYSDHRCAAPTPRGGRIRDQREISEVADSVCRDIEQPNWMLSIPAEPLPLDVRFGNWMQEKALLLVAWPSILFGDPGTIRGEQRELEASTIATYLVSKAGFDLDDSIAKFPSEQSLAGNCRDLTAKRSLEVAKASLDDDN